MISTTSSEAAPANVAAELEMIASEISRREVAAETAEQWYDTGRDLIRAKRLVGRDHFCAWCDEKLPYDARTARRYMRAAKVLLAAVKTDIVSVPPNMTLVLRIATFTKDAAERAKLVARATSCDPAELKTLKAIVQSAKKQTRRNSSKDSFTGSAERLKASMLLQSCLGEKLHELVRLCRVAGSNQVLNDKLRDQILRVWKSRTRDILIEPDAE